MCVLKRKVKKDRETDRKGYRLEREKEIEKREKRMEREKDIEKLGKSREIAILGVHSAIYPLLLFLKQIFADLFCLCEYLKDINRDDICLRLRRSTIH